MLNVTRPRINSSHIWRHFVNGSGDAEAETEAEATWT